MNLAFVLVNCEVGAEDQAFREVAKIEEVKEVYAMYGVYDLIVKVEASSLDAIKEVIASKIRRISNVKSTLVLIVARSIKSG